MCVYDEPVSSQQLLFRIIKERKNKLAQRTEASQHGSTHFLYDPGVTGVMEQ